MPKEETFNLTSLQETKPELISGDYYSVSMRVRKGIGQVDLDKFIKAQDDNKPTTFEFYSPSGFLIQVPIILITLTEYHDPVPYDVLDIIVEIKPEIKLMLDSPDLEFFSY